MKILLTLSIPIWFLQFFPCNINESLVSNAALMCVCAVCLCGGWWCEDVHLWTVCRSTRVWSHRAAAWERWSGHCTQHSPSCHPPRSYPLWKTSPPTRKQTHETKPWIHPLNITLIYNKACGYFVNISMYLQENHQTTPKLRDVQGLSYLNPPRTSGPLF